MRINEFIEKEQKLNKKAGFALEIMLNDLKDSDKYLLEPHKYKLYGFLSALHSTDYISKEIYDELFKDIQNIALETFKKLWSL